MKLKTEIIDILNKIQKENKQLNFDSAVAREAIADFIVEFGVVFIDAAVVVGVGRCC